MRWNHQVLQDIREKLDQKLRSVPSMDKEERELLVECLVETVKEVAVTYGLAPLVEHGQTSLVRESP
jgi:hypothetical protein